jgi:hypothetical protein
MPTPEGDATVNVCARLLKVAVLGINSQVLKLEKNS